MQKDSKKGQGPTYKWLKKAWKKDSKNALVKKSYQKRLIPRIKRPSYWAWPI
jgi:hypothetical protein